MNYLIIDDEPIAHRIIEGYCSELPHLQKVGNAYHAMEASALLGQHPVDLIFLDINMPKMTGFAWLKTLRHPPQIIVTTAYQEYALEGYELNVVDYLLKPFSLARFLQAIQKVHSPDRTPSSAPVAPLPPSSDPSFFLKGDKTHHQVKASEILYVEAYGNYTKVYLSDRMILTHKKISELEQMLPAPDFMRVHKSFLVARAKIASIQGNQILIADHTIPIGQTYRSKINDLLSGK